MRVTYSDVKPPRSFLKMVFNELNTFHSCSLLSFDSKRFPDYESELPVSEKSNPLTRDIDQASANHVVRLLRACDAEILQDERKPF